jgi:hypothetical protein
LASNVFDDLIIEKEEKSEGTDKKFEFFEWKFKQVNVSFVVFNGELIEELLRAQTWIDSKKWNRMDCQLAWTILAIKGLLLLLEEKVGRNEVSMLKDRVRWSHTNEFVIFV